MVRLYLKEDGFLDSIEFLRNKGAALEIQQNDENYIQFIDRVAERASDINSKFNIPLEKMLWSDDYKDRIRCIEQDYRLNILIEDKDNRVKSVTRNYLMKQEQKFIYSTSELHIGGTDEQIIDQMNEIFPNEKWLYAYGYDNEPFCDGGGWGDDGPYPFITYDGRTERDLYSDDLKNWHDYKYPRIDDFDVVVVKHIKT